MIGWCAGGTVCDARQRGAIAPNFLVLDRSRIICAVFSLALSTGWRGRG